MSEHGRPLVKGPLTSSDEVLAPLEFDITSTSKQHLAFGHGVHFCLRVPLARLEAEIVLPALFARFLDLVLAVAPIESTPLSSFISNGHCTLPVVRGASTTNC
jgi:cytochrome P450